MPLWGRELAGAGRLCPFLRCCRGDYMRFEKPPARGTKQLHSHVPERGCGWGQWSCGSGRPEGGGEGWVGALGPPHYDRAGAVSPRHGECARLSPGCPHIPTKWELKTTETHHLASWSQKPGLRGRWGWFPRGCRGRSVLISPAASLGAPGHADHPPASAPASRRSPWVRVQTSPSHQDPSMVPCWHQGPLWPRTTLSFPGFQRHYFRRQSHSQVWG